jgi:hypothetical protein
LLREISSKILNRRRALGFSSLISRKKHNLGNYLYSIRREKEKGKE